MESLTRCEACYWEDALRKRVRLASMELKQEWVVELLHAFADEETRRGAGKKAALRMPATIGFLCAVESRFQNLDDLCSLGLHARFSQGELRSHLCCSTYLLETLSLPVPSADVLIEDDLQRRIRRLMSVSRPPWSQKLLEQFSATLDESLSARSRYGYLHAASQTLALSTTADAEDVQRAARNLVNKKPGIRNSLSRFLGFVGVTTPGSTSRRPSAAKKSVTDVLRGLYESATEARDDVATAALIGALYDVSLTELESVRASDFDAAARTLTVSTRQVSLPEILAAVVPERKDGALFRGARGAGLNRQNISAYLRREYGHAYGALRSLVARSRDRVDPWETT